MLKDYQLFILHIMADDFSRVVLSCTPGVAGSDYINASSIDVSPGLKVSYGLDNKTFSVQKVLTLCHWMLSHSQIYRYCGRLISYY